MPVPAQDHEAPDEQRREEEDAEETNVAHPPDSPIVPDPLPFNQPIQQDDPLIVQLDHSYGASGRPVPPAANPGPSSERRGEKRPAPALADDDLTRATLPQTKGRAGRPKKTKRLDNHKNHPKPFHKKTKPEQKRSK